MPLRIIVLLVILVGLSTIIVKNNQEVDISLLFWN